MVNTDLLEFTMEEFYMGVFYMEEVVMEAFTMSIITMEGNGRVPCYHILPAARVRTLSKYFSGFTITTQST